MDIIMDNRILHEFDTKREHRNRANEEGRTTDRETQKKELESIANEIQTTGEAAHWRINDRNRERQLLDQNSIHSTQRPKGWEQSTRSSRVRAEVCTAKLAIGDAVHRWSVRRGLLCLAAVHGGLLPTSPAMPSSLECYPQSRIS